MEKTPKYNENEVVRLAYDADEMAVKGYLDAQFKRRASDTLYTVDNQAEALLAEVNKQHELYGKRAWLTGVFHVFNDQATGEEHASIPVIDTSVVLGNFTTMATMTEQGVDPHYVWQSATLPTEKGYLHGFIDAEAVYNTQHAQAAQHIELAQKSQEYYENILQTTVPQALAATEAIVRSNIHQGHMHVLTQIQANVLPQLPQQPLQLRELVAEAMAGYISHQVADDQGASAEYKIQGTYQLSSCERYSTYAHQQTNAQRQTLYNPRVFMESGDRGYEMGVEGEMEYCQLILRARIPMSAMMDAHSQQKHAQQGVEHGTV